MVCVFVFLKYYVIKFHESQRFLKVKVLIDWLIVKVLNLIWDCRLTFIFLSMWILSSLIHFTVKHGYGKKNDNELMLTLKWLSIPMTLFYVVNLTDIINCAYIRGSKIVYPWHVVIIMFYCAPVINWKVELLRVLV